MCLHRRLRTPSVLRRAVTHVIAAAWQDVDRLVAAHRLDVRDQFPHLLIGDLVAPRRHAVRTAFDDRFEDVAGRAAVDPLVVHQWRAHATAAMGVAASAVELVEETLAFRGAVRVSLKWALVRFRERLAARKEWAEHRLLRPSR